MRQLKITKSITNRESASLDKYLQEIGREELISVQEEVELAQRIRKGDRVLVLPATVPVDNAVMVFQSEGEYYIRKIKLQDGNRALMQWYDYEPRSEVKSLKELTLVGRARRVEFDL